MSARRASKGNGHSSIGKMAFGAGLLGASFLVLIFAVSVVDSAEKISFLWLALCTLIYTIGELYLSPVGLSLVTKVSPAKSVSTVMGLWFLSTFFGNYLAGYIGTFYSSMPTDNFFLLLTGLGVGTGVVIFSIKPLLEKSVAPSTK